MLQVGALGIEEEKESPDWGDNMKPLAPSLVPKILFPLQFFETTA
jgi:hypothetical protein